MTRHLTDLPPETLILVFQHACFPHSIEDSRAEYALRQAETIIQVCRKWYDLICGSLFKYKNGEVAFILHAQSHTTTLRRVSVSEKFLRGFDEQRKENWIQYCKENRQSFMLQKGKLENLG